MSKLPARIVRLVDQILALSKRDRQILFDALDRQGVGPAVNESHRKEVQALLLMHRSQADRHSRERKQRSRKPKYSAEYLTEFKRKEGLTWIEVDAELGLGGGTARHTVYREKKRQSK
jgi:hypothetical protein